MWHYTGEELQGNEVLLPSGSYESLLREDMQDEVLTSTFYAPHVRKILHRLINRLPANERHVVLLKYPLDSHSRSYNDREIAIMLECSDTWVRDLRRKAFCKLRKRLAALDITSWEGV